MSTQYARNFPANKPDTGRTPILRATKADWLAVGAISAVCAVAIGGAIITAPIHKAELTPAVNAVAHPQLLDAAPSALTEAFSLPNALVTGQTRAVTAKGLLITHDGDTLNASDASGDTVWTYQRRDADLCVLGSAWDKVVAAYDAGNGCGDVVSIDAATGQYSDTRSSRNSEQVVPILSNDRVGTVSTERVELWRSDMVRTVEYGDVDAKQEPDLQPHEDCTITSALTRTETMGVTESCPDSPDSTWLRIQKVTPEDSRSPEITTAIKIETPGARLVAFSQEAAAIFLPGDTPRIITCSFEGKTLSSTDVEPSKAIMDSASPFAPAVADLPHHMTWFDGERLYLFTPTELKVDHVLEQAVGTGIAVGERLLVPTEEGIDVVDWATGKTERSIPVDRDGYNGPVSLTLAGTAIIEQRGNTAVALTAS
ncbi:hypothetical protein [Corynebacterium aurimucosum]|uniref:Rv3212 family protein n=1 Tax=Corynebacterium aurimucosum TaxID=169292 RepID=UPI003990860A